MSTQKEIQNALRLAAEFRPSMPADVMKLWAADVAQELRAQHELVQTLKAALETCRYVLSIEGCKYTADIAQKAIDAAEAHK